MFYKLVYAETSSKVKDIKAPAPSTYSKINLKALNREEIADYIGWVPKSMPLQICQGYYYEPNLYYQEIYKGDKNKGPIHITADKSQFSQEGGSTLSGNVVVTQPNRKIDADFVYLNRDPNTKKIVTIDAFGNVILREPGTLMIGDRGHFNLVDKSSNLNDVIYRMSSTPVVEPVDASGTPIDDQVILSTLNSWGTAQKVKRLPSGIIKVQKGSYTACPPSMGGWRLTSNNLTLNKDTGRGTATNALLYLDKVPIMYTPYFNFPIDDRRQTGFLYPTFGHSTNSGTELGVPFYWNIAPNYDATITPNYMTLRGLQLNGEFRYLTQDSTGNFHGSFLPNDSEFSSFQNESDQEILGLDDGRLPSKRQQAELDRLRNDSDDRYFVSLKDNRHYSQHWSSYLYLNKASDDYYFEDFDDDQAQTSDNQIKNEGDIYFNSQHWHFRGRSIVYQTLHPVNQGNVSNQYKKLPELKLDTDYPGLKHNLNFTAESQFDDFAINRNPGQETKKVEGARSYLNPDVYISKYWTWGYIKPDLQLPIRQYDLQYHDNVVDPKRDNHISSALPILDVDGGLFFERETHFFSHHYTQTLEPRLFYLYVPYQDQDNIPLFDTTIDPFSYSQLFQTNRYTGIDRIGDTNQISAAITTRFVDGDTGDEKARFSVGQIYYFENRRVNLEERNLSLVTRDNEVSPTADSSPIAAQMAYKVSENWHFLGDVAMERNLDNAKNMNLLFQYKTDNAHILNLGYNFLEGGDAFRPADDTKIPDNSHKNNLNQTDFSLVWPITKKWQFIGRWNYNISHDYPQTYYGGLQYDSCCWSVRVLAGREFDYLDNNNTPIFDNRIYFQIALKTLGNVGANDPSSMLKSDIPGYVDNFGMVNSL